MKYKFYYINMERSQNRRTLTEKILSDNNITFERVEAIDGNTLLQYQSKLAQHNMSVYELGCTLSHLKAIQQFLSNEMESNETNCYAIICEDDISFEFSKYWKQSLEDYIENKPDDCDILQLCVGATKLDEGPITYFNYNRGSHWGTGAYLISQRLAKKLVDKFRDIDTIINQNYKPVSDLLIYSNTNTNIYYYYPSLITARTDNDSLIHPEHFAGQQYHYQIQKNCWIQNSKI